MESLVDPVLEDYAAQHSDRPNDLLKEVEAYTYANVDIPQMVVGGLEAAFLQMMVKLTNARRVLEVGLFTGYSSLAMAEALDDSGSIISCEISEENAAIARSFIERSPYTGKIDIRIGPAADSIAELEGPFDLVFLDADKENYPNYYDLVLPRLKSGGIIIADNVLWSGKVLKPEEESDHALVAFNKKVQADPAVENVLLTVRDGVMLVRKL